MKLTLVAVVASVMVLSAVPSYAQPGWGVTAGAGLARVISSICRIDEEPCNLDNQVTFNGGGYAILGPAKSMVTFEPQLLFSMKGGKDPEGSKGRNKLNYFEVPMLARVDASVGQFKPFVVVGPEIGVRATAKGSGGEDLKDDFKSTEFGLVIGGGARVNNKIGLEARYEQSLQDQLTSTGRSNFGVNGERDRKFYNRLLSFMVDLNLSKSGK